MGFGGSWFILGMFLPHNTPLKFNIPPEKWWLEDDPFLLGKFSRAMLNFRWVCRRKYQGFYLRISTKTFGETYGQMDSDCHYPLWGASEIFNFNSADGRQL